MFKKMKLSLKLIITFLAVGIIPFTVIGVVSLFKANDALSDQAFSKLIGIRELKKAQMEDFFGQRKTDMGILMEMVDTLKKSAFEKLKGVSEIKKAQIQDLFRQDLNGLNVMSSDGLLNQ